MKFQRLITGSLIKSITVAVEIKLNVIVQILVGWRHYETFQGAFNQNFCDNISVGISPSSMLPSIFPDWWKWNCSRKP